MTEQEPSALNDISALIDEGRRPFFIDAVACVIPPKGATRGNWTSVDQCDFTNRAGETLGQGEVIILHPAMAARLQKQISETKEQDKQI